MFWTDYKEQRCAFSSFCKLGSTDSLFDERRHIGTSCSRRSTANGTSLSWPVTSQRPSTLCIIISVFGFCISYLFIVVTQSLTRRGLRKQEFILAHSLRVPAIMVGKAWWDMMNGMAGHMTSAVRKQRAISILRCLSPFYSIRCHSHLGWIFPHQLT